MIALPHMSFDVPPFPRNMSRAAMLWLLAIIKITSVIMLCCLFSPNASAQVTTPAGNTPAAQSECLTGQESPPPQAGTGILTQIIITLQTIITAITKGVFNSIVTNPGFIYAITALTTLYVAIYGIFFMLGLLGQVTISDFVGRIIKVGMLTLLLSPNAWDFFNTNVVQFFNAGIDDIIYQVIHGTAAHPGILPTEYAANIKDPSANPDSSTNYQLPPFYIVDPLMGWLGSTKMGVTLKALFSSGPYGLALGLMLALSIGKLLQSLLMLAWVYIMSMVLRSLLFGLFPIFLAFGLFSRTRPLLDGCINQIILSCFSVIFLFLFNAWYVVLVEGAVLNIYDVPVCFEKVKDNPGDEPDEYKWGFEVAQKDPNTGQTVMKPYYNEDWTWTGPRMPKVQGQPPYKGPITPISPLNILIFLVITEGMRRFNNTAIEFAGLLAGATNNIAGMSGAFGSWMSPSSGGNQKPGGGAAPGRAAPGKPSVAADSKPGRPGPGLIRRKLTDAAKDALTDTAKDIASKGMQNYTSELVNRSSDNTGKRT